MRVTLERVDTRGLRVDLPSPARDQAVVLASASNLRGTLAIDEGKTTLSDVLADDVILASLRILLGELVLSSAAGARLTGLGLALEQSAGGLALDVTAASLLAEDLSVVIGDVAVRGRAHLGGVKLVVREGAGSLAAESVELGALSLRIGDLELAAEVVRGERVTIAWGPDPFRLTGAGLHAPSLRVTVPDTAIAAEDVTLAGLDVDGGSIGVARAAVESARVEVTLAASAPADAAGRAPAAPSRAGEPLVDLSLLDALNGRLDVDVAVDLTVPIIGRRHATHRLRVAIDQGTIDYLALEKNLSRLEDAILDFAVRDGGLALERVNPLLPARGHGKPIVVWDLDAGDLELAKNDRVRLAVLPTARVVGADDPKPGAPPAKSPIALRQLAFVGIDARLSVTPGEPALERGQLRLKRVGSLALGGEVRYDPGEPAPPGLLRGDLAELAASVHGLAVGASVLDVEAVEAVRVAPFEIVFADVTPTAIRLDLNRLALERIAFRPST
ncbi:MAG: hypothetical protein KF764_00620 [Labilithrix sp.]|nr:hypothetical protein [Labilithrix sp.]